MTSEKTQKNSFKYSCEKCDFYSNNRNDYRRHLKTKKHNTSQYLQPDLQKTPYSCECGKHYKHRQSLNNHKKTCTYIVEEEPEKNVENEILDTLESKNIDMRDVLLDLVSSNKDLKDQIIKLAKEPKTVINNQQNNNTFSLNTFLHVDCKDAMNLSEFLDKIKFRFQDLLYLGDHGFVESFNDTFIKQLKDMEQTKRPIHCTDQKRKAMFVKENDMWKRDENNEIIYNTIDKVNRKQIQAFTEHKKERDEDFLDDEKNLDNNNKIIIEMCGYNKQQSDSVNKKLLKSIANISKIKK